METIQGLEKLPEVITEEWIEQAIEKLEKSQLTTDQRMKYEMMLAKGGSILYMEEEKRRVIFEEAKEVARKEETKKALERAKKLKEINTEIEIIMIATGLTREEIENCD